MWWARRTSMVSTLLLCGNVLAQAPAADPLPEIQATPTEFVWLAASDHTLDQLRGGFDLGKGLMVSFGISRAVSINGQLVTSTQFQINDFTRLTSQQVTSVSQLRGAQAQVVSNGPGNKVDPSALTVPFSTFVQNTLSNQTIRSETVIQASSNGLGLIKNLNLQQSLNDAINHAIGQR